MERTEESEQARLIKWSHRQAVRSLIPALAYLHHSPNGGNRSSFTGAQMKALGVKRGFPDLILPAKQPNHALATEVFQHPGLVIEMKSATGKLSPEQVTWLEHFDNNGWLTRTCRSAEEGRLAICQYFGLNANDVPALDA